MLKLPAIDLKFGDEVQLGIWRAQVRHVQPLPHNKCVVRFMQHDGGTLADITDRDCIYPVIAREAA